MTKKCSKCGQARETSEFCKDRSRPDGLATQCRSCRSSANARWRSENREAYASKRSDHYRDNADRLRAVAREAYKRDREAHSRRVQDWLGRNPGYRADYARARRRDDPAFAMVGRLRARLRHALSGQAKPSSTMDLVGCSPEKLCAWLEMHFAEGMTWENRSEWHIDHIRPIASFEDPADPECWHWSNLQPLWAEDNLRKSDRWT